MKKPRMLMYAAIAVLGASIGIPVHAEPGTAPAQGRHAREVRKYRYVYYPAQRVYYAPQRQIWFWMNRSGGWNYGVHLPSRLRGRTTTGLPVVLSGKRPFLHHKYVEERYGRPWREKAKSPEPGKESTPRPGR